ncbi:MULTISPECIES: ribonuclease III [Rickettsieae]|uniref:ribonuclease III n=1 Tax=Rickettsieae TaxID=33988 RepID=UPI000B9B41D6|nr:ribonuclease III [Rickettsia endosymbiont of Culicoides newsteadi]MDN3030137.1 ribonuclease III [Candidatus Tisiphia sp.]OZG32125.1 ribonuclease 3 [Rickettsia endosymbiont of Culicoides newsteadi]
MSTKELTLSAPEKLEQDIGYSFNDKNFLLEALSHPSLKQNTLKHGIQKNYERLELLGDTIINFAITEILFKNFSTYNEGKLAKIRAYLVCKELLCKVAAKINLSDYIIMTYGEELLGGRQNPNNIENTMEALIAAIYLDSNIDTVKKIIYDLWYEFIDIIDLADYDPKSTLQELAQKKGSEKPVYQVIKREGSPHAAIFTVLVQMDEYQQTGTGHSVKEAEKVAARKLMNYLNNL